MAHALCAVDASKMPEVIDAKKMPPEELKCNNKMKWPQQQHWGYSVL